jgi:hypothetical protein
MTVATALQLALALLVALQQGLDSGLLTPDEPLDVTTLGDAHKQALKDLAQILDTP